MEFKMSQVDLDSGTPEFEVTINGNAENEAELRLKAIKYLLSSFDVKHDFNGEYEKLHSVVEETILSAVDLVGYEHFYWENVPSEEKFYNENEELVVSKKAKLQLLELILQDMKGE